MLETMLITFREGLEAFLIIAIMLAYLTKTGRRDLVKPVYAGIGAAFLVCATTGWHVAGLASDPVWEGALAMTAGILVASFTLYVMRTAKNIRQNIGESLKARAQQSGAAADIGIFLFTVLMIAREGMETALMLGAISAGNHPAAMWAGALAGFAGVGVIAYLWTTQSQKINLRLFLQVTGVFLVLFSVELFLYGLHELSEMAAIPLIGESLNMSIHTWSEPFERAVYSGAVNGLLLGLPMLWLAVSFFRGRAAQAALSAAE